MRPPAMLRWAAVALALAAAALLAAAPAAAFYLPGVAPNDFQKVPLPSPPPPLPRNSVPSAPDLNGQIQIQCTAFVVCALLSGWGQWGSGSRRPAGRFAYVRSSVVSPIAFGLTLPNLHLNSDRRLHSN